jgi:uncharacterized membrane protein
MVPMNLGIIYQGKEVKNMKRLLLGTFEKHKDADAALKDMEKEGVDREAVSIITMQDTAGEYSSEKNGKGGAIAGGVLGGLAGLLLTAAPVVLPGAILVAGPLTVLTGAALGAITGGIIGALVDIGVSEESARAYEQSIMRGGVLLAVTVDDDTRDIAQEIMEKHNAEELTLIPYNRNAKKLEQRFQHIMHQ